MYIGLPLVSIKPLGANGCLLVAKLISLDGSCIGGKETKCLGVGFWNLNLITIRVLILRYC